MSKKKSESITADHIDALFTLFRENPNILHDIVAQSIETNKKNPEVKKSTKRSGKQ